MISISIWWPSTKFTLNQSNWIGSGSAPRQKAEPAEEPAEEPLGDLGGEEGEEGAEDAESDLDAALADAGGEGEGEDDLDLQLQEVFRILEEEVEFDYDPINDELGKFQNNRSRKEYNQQA